MSSSAVSIRIPFLRGAVGLRELVALGALAGMVATGFMLVLGSASTRPSFSVPSDTNGIPGWVAGPLARYGTTMTAARFILLLSAMWVCYLLALAFSDAVRARWAIATVVTLTLLFTLAPPLLSRDVFNYVDYARLGVTHHLNPYRHGPIAAHNDPVFPFVRWRSTPSVYGPLFTLASYPLALLGLAGALWTLKVMTGLASLGCVALVWRCAKRVGTSPVFAGLLVGLNPVLLVYAVGGAHNDVLALLPLVAGLTLALENRWALGGASVFAAVAMKATAGLMLPFMILGSRRRWAVLAGMSAAVVLIGAVAFAVFGTAALEPFKLASQHQRFYFVQSVPPHLAVLLGADPRSATVRRIAEIAALIAIVILLVRTALQRQWLSGAGWATLAGLVATTWLLAWYTIWALPFAALARDRRLVYAALSLGTFVIVSRLYYLRL